MICKHCRAVIGFRKPAGWVNPLWIDSNGWGGSYVEDEGAYHPHEPANIDDMIEELLIIASSS